MQAKLLALLSDDHGRELENGKRVAPTMMIVIRAVSDVGADEEDDCYHRYSHYIQLLVKLTVVVVLSMVHGMVPLLPTLSQ